MEDAEGTSTPTGEENQADTARRVERLFTAIAFDELEKKIFEVRKEGGYGRVYIDIEAGAIRFIGKDIKTKVV